MGATENKQLVQRQELTEYADTELVTAVLD
jgi:hypothetical protein